MNKRWLIALTLVAALGGAFTLGGVMALAGRDFLTARLAGIPFIAGTLQVQEDQDEDAATDERGIVITDVRAGSPAAEAGLQRGDILLAIDDAETDSLRDVREAIAGKAAGDTVTLRITRGGTEQSSTATLSDLEDAIFLGIKACGMGHGGGFGRMFPSGPGDVGAQITEVVAGSPAAAAGLQADDVITAVNGEALAHPMALGDVIATHKPGDGITLTVRGADESERDVEVTLSASPDDDAVAYLGIRYQPSLAFGHLWRGAPGEEGWESVPAIPALPGGLMPPLGEGEVFGALVVAAVEDGSAAGEAGLQRGDHISEINGTPVAELVESGGDVGTIFADYEPGETVTLTVLRNGESDPLSMTATLGEDGEGNAVLGIQAGIVMTVNGDDAPFSGAPVPDLLVPGFDAVPAAPEIQA